MNPLLISRRRFLLGSLALPAAAALLSVPGRAEEWPGALDATPECPDDEPTPRETEGPFYTPNTPRRRNFLEKGVDGDRITLVGYVVDRNCKPIPNALVDLWHADAQGEYDNEGFKCRGHQFTDARGRYWFETVMPGIYPGRTRHYHVRVQPAKSRILSTQLYFPDEPRNKRDGLFTPELLMGLSAGERGKQARFDFVIG